MQRFIQPIAVLPCGAYRASNTTDPIFLSVPLSVSPSAQPTNRPLSRRTNATRSPLQRDNGLQLLADVDKLLDATRSLLEDLGLEVENDDDDGNAAATPMDQDAGAEEEEEEEERDPPSPPRQLENRAPVNAVGPPSAVEPDAQTPPQLLPQDQASAEKAASPATASGGDEETIARSHTPLPLPPVEADTSLAPPAGVEGPGADEDAMDAP